jgi:CRISPR type I-A-associated protein Csa5
MSESLSGKYENVISLLKFFIDDNRYSIVDRIAFALSPESAEVSLLEALRVVKSLMERVCKVKIKTDNKEYTVNCCDYGLDEGPGINGVFVEVFAEACNPEFKGKKGFCVPCPSIPSNQELEELLNDLRKDLTVGRRLAILAYGYRKSSEGE